MSPRGKRVMAVFVFAVVLVVGTVLAARRGIEAPAPAPVTPLGPPRLRVAFRYRAGGAIHAPVALDAQGRVYLTAHDGLLHALDARGRLRFTRRLDGGAERKPLPPAWGGPLVTADGRVLVGSDAGVLHAFDLQGKRLTTRGLGGPIDRTPVALGEGGALVVAGRAVVALDPALRPRYRFEARAKVFASPAVDPQGRAYVGAQDDFLYALDREGQVRFRVRAGGDLDAAPLWLDGVVFAGSDDGRVIALDAEDGSLRWEAQLGGYVRAPLVRGSGGTLLAATFGPRPRLVALDVRDGRERWSYTPGWLESTERGLRGGAVADGAGRVYVGGYDDHLHTLSAQGELRSRLPLRGDVEATPVSSSDGTLWVGTASGWLYGLRP